MKRFWKSIVFFAIANMLALAAAHAEPQYIKFRSQVVGCSADLYYALNESVAKSLAREAEIYFAELDRGRPLISGEFELKTKCQFYSPSYSHYGKRLVKTSDDGVPAGKIAVCFQPTDFSTGPNRQVPPCVWVVVRPDDVIIANDWR
jgi:hypothetical protein